MKNTSKTKTALVLLLALLAPVVSSQALVYDFLPVTIIGMNSCQFTSQNVNGNLEIKLPTHKWHALLTAPAINPI